MPEIVKPSRRSTALVLVSVLAAGVCLAAPLSVDTLRNAAYPSGYAPEGEIRLHRGVFHERFGTRGEVSIEMTDHVAIGMLSDGTRAAAVVLRTTTGGNATFHDLTLMVQDGEAPRWRATTPLGDRVVVDKIRIDGGEVVVTLRAHDVGDAMCCPSLRVENRYFVSGPRLVAR